MLGEVEPFTVVAASAVEAGDGGCGMWLAIGGRKSSQ